MEEKIIEIAKSVFIEKGYVEASMSEIAAKVGINRPGLHYYYHTKDKMFEAVLSNILSSIMPTVTNIISQKDKKISIRIEEVVNTYYSLFIENPKLPMFIIREINRDANFLIETANKLHLHERFFTATKSIQEEMDEGKLKKIPIRFLFYNFYSLLSIPFLSQDLTLTVFLEENESFEDLLTKWKPYIVSQMENLLATEK